MQKEMSSNRELSIKLNQNGAYYPGDIVIGQVILKPRKSVDVQHLSINLTGIIEGCGDKATIINDTKLLATPSKADQKYTTYNNNQSHTFDFEFKLPKDKKLPSCVNIPKIAKIVYLLTATHKKPMFKFSNTLPSTTMEITVLDMINVLLPDYQIPVQMKGDIGFVNGSKLTQWCLNVSKAAFIRGGRIAIECSMDHFPLMDKTRALKLSLVRQTHKTSSAKILENKVLCSKSMDLHFTTKTSSQCFLVELDIPHNTPPSVFPDTGRTLSVSYSVQAKLDMKGVKSAIKLKSSYIQEIAVVVGTFPTTDSISHNRHSKQQAQFSSVKNRSSTAELRFQMNNRSSHNIQRRASTMQPLLNFPEMEGVKPLPRLDEILRHKASKSYVSLSTTGRSFSSSSEVSVATTPGPATPGSNYQDQFDEYISPSSLRSPPLSPTIDRSMTPLPSMKSSDINPHSTISYLTRKNTNKPSGLSVSAILSSPHEIGPDDVIAKVIPMDKPHLAVSSEEKEYIGDTNDDGISQQSGTTSPSLLFRNDTVSTASSAGIADLPCNNRIVPLTLHK